MLLHQLISGCVLLSALLACGGGGGGSTSPSAPQTASGVFVDSPVAGLHYHSGSHSGETDSQGRFIYEIGQTVTFSLGGIVLPAIAGSAFVTPLSVFSAEGYNDLRVINLARLLQTLDADGNPANGIVIPASALSAAAGIALTDFGAADFDAKVDALVKSVGGTQLVAASAALTHLMGQSIVGTWYFEEPAQAKLELFTFLPEGTLLYGVHAPTHADEPIDGGIQRADYTWDPATGALVISHLDINTAGSWGVTEPALGQASVVWHVTGPATATATTTRIGHASQTFQVKRLQATPDPLQGTWVLREPGRTMHLAEVVIVDDRYVMITVGQADSDGKPGLDFGTYTFEPTSGLFTASPWVDTNGSWGITLDASTGASEILTINGNNLTNSQNPPNTLQRLEPSFAATLGRQDRP